MRPPPRGRRRARDEPERERLVGRDAPTAHDDVLRAAEPDEPRQPLRAARARDHPDRHLGQAELHVLRRETEVARERQLEADAEDEPLQRGDHRLRAALGRGDVLGKPRDVPRRALQKPRDVAARGERPARAGEDDEAHAVVAVELLEETAQLVAREHRDAVVLAGHVERDPGDVAVTLDAEAVVLAHALTSFRVG